MTFAAPEKGVAVPNAGDMQVDLQKSADRVWIFLAGHKAHVVRGRAFKPRLVASKTNLGVGVFCIVGIIGYGRFRRHQDGSLTGQGRSRRDATEDAKRFAS